MATLFNIHGTRINAVSTVTQARNFSSGVTERDSAGPESRDGFS
jgi:hypothetical protein